jgi:thiamine-monophosphate kinase
MVDYEKILTMEGVAIVGHITKPAHGLQLVGREGEEIELRAQGWNSLNE